MDSGFKVLDSEFLVSGIWILDSNRQWILGSLSCIPDSKAQGTGFHSKKNCRIPESTSKYFSHSEIRPNSLTRSERVDCRTSICGTVGYRIPSLVSCRIYSISRPGRLLNFWTFRVGAYSRWALLRGCALIKFSPFSASVLECLFCNKIINGNNKTRRCNKARFL